MPPKHKCHGKRVQRYYNFANLASFFLFFSSFVGKLARNRPRHYLRFLEKVKTFTGLFAAFSWSFKINKVLLQPETNTNSITIMKKLLLSLTMLLMAVSSQAALTLKAQGGWFESCWMEFEGLSSSYSIYNGYVSADGGNTWAQLDGELIRSYGSYGRVDALGLKAGNYLLKVIPVSGNAEVMADAVQTPSAIEVKAFDRSGYAHFNYTDGVGAYNNDGTLKAAARVIYVTGETAKTIKLSVKSDSKGGETEFTGLQSIITAHQKGLETRPLCIRFIGTIKADDMDGFDSSAEGLQIKGKAKDAVLNMTFEGVGNDAFIYGFGFLVRNAASVEMRNFGVATLMDDDISLDTDNDHIWIHNIDAFYGKQGGGDHAKGDGAIDVKSNSKHVTVSYCHFWDTGKSTMCGMKSESGPNYITYHHNWFDHSDSRHARIRTMSVHMYNNFYDNIAKYGAGACTGSSVFMDRNYFKNCSKPMMISLQGTDTKNGTDYKNAPTFSGEDGGMIKAYGNAFSGTYTLAKYSATNKVEFDCYEVSNPSDQVPSSVTAKEGAAKYNNFDTDGSMYTTYAVDAAEDVPAKVSDRTWGAGREQGGDFVFDFSDQPASDYAVIPALRSAIDNYKSKFVAVIGKEGMSGGGSEPVDPTDKREESVFALTSSAKLTLDQNTTSDITFSGQAGTVTFISNNTSIATVDANGKITAVAPGKTMIIVKDAGSDQVKDKTLEVTVTVIGQVIVDGDIIIQAGELPYGYDVDGETTMALWEYSKETKNNSLFKITKGQAIIKIPEGVKVTSVTLYGWADDNNKTSKVTELAGQTLTSSNVLANRKSGTLSSVTVNNIAITDELTFTIDYKAGVKLSLKVAKDEAAGIQTINTYTRTTGKSAKYLKDGRLVIEHNDKQYNVAGVIVK